MHDSGAFQWREVLEKHHSALLAELAACVDHDLQTAASRAVAEEQLKIVQHTARACDDARRAHAESLNQALRRLRQAESGERVLNLLNESCGAYASQSAVIVFESARARVIAARGTRSASAMVFETEAAPAIISAIESRDLVVALAVKEQISESLTLLFESEAGADESARAYLFPIVARHAVTGMLIASGEVVSAPLELLCEAAGMRLESLAAVTDKPVPEALIPPKLSWEALSADEQSLHLQAQRMARVKVAEMRLDQADALQRGLAKSNIYGTLQAPVDAARQQFLQMFLSKSPTMVDYLHLEIVKTLAGNDDGLLGQQYPGPMV